MPEPRAAFQDVEARLWPSISAAMPAPKPPKPRGRVWAYLMGWISPQWPKADPAVCYRLETELGMEHWFTQETAIAHTLQQANASSVVHGSLGSGPKMYYNHCLDCGASWHSTEADYLCAACHDKEVAYMLGEPPEPTYEAIRG